jgi:hypothetical protein
MRVDRQTDRQTSNKKLSPNKKCAKNCDLLNGFGEFGKH